MRQTNAHERLTEPVLIQAMEMLRGQRSLRFLGPTLVPPSQGAETFLRSTIPLP